MLKGTGNREQGTGSAANFNRNDLCFRLQKADATLAEMETFAAAQTRDYTDSEQAAIDGVMARIEQLFAERGYALPATDGVVFIKTTMAEENDAGGYTHGTQIYLGEVLMEYALSGDPDDQALFDEIVVHELVPVDDLGTMYTSEDAANFWDVFGRNTDDVIDPEETLADNFAMTVLYGPDGQDYESPEIIAAIDALLKDGAA